LFDLNIKELFETFNRGWYSFKKSKLSLLGLAIVISLVILGVFGRYLAPYPGDETDIHPAEAFQPPSTKHIMGTDEIGRDVFSRIILGTRVSLGATVVITLIGLVIGIPLGLVSGMAGGTIDVVLTKATEVIISIPSLVLILVIAVVLGRSLPNAIYAIGFTSWPIYTLLVRGEVRHIKQEAFVEASKSLGASTLRIGFQDVLPNTLTPVVIRAALNTGTVVLTLASLGFLGFGAVPPTPEWGTMASTSRYSMPYIWWPCAASGLIIVLTVLGFHLFGDGLRAALTGQ